MPSKERLSVPADWKSSAGGGAILFHNPLVIATIASCFLGLGYL